MLTEEKKNTYRQLNSQDVNSALLDACEIGFLESVRYLLTSEELYSKADIHFQKDSAFNFSMFKRIFRTCSISVNKS